MQNPRFTTTFVKRLPLIAAPSTHSRSRVQQVINPARRGPPLYTDDRRDNFDIYLPLWLARHNELVFGWLFAAGLAFTLGRWPGWPR
jgi:hypothetical protein